MTERILGKTPLEIAAEIERDQLRYEEQVTAEGVGLRRWTVYAGHRIMGYAEVGEAKCVIGTCHLFGYEVCRAGTRATVGNKLRAYRVEAWRERAELSRTRPQPGDAAVAIQALRHAMGERKPTEAEADEDDRGHVGDYALEHLWLFGDRPGVRELVERWADGDWSPWTDAQLTLSTLLAQDHVLAELWSSTPVGGYSSWAEAIGARLAEIARA
jgi:hypothetical protein